MIDKMVTIRWYPGREIKSDFFAQNVQILRSVWESVEEAREALKLNGYLFQFAGSKSDLLENYEVWVKLYD